MQLIKDKISLQELEKMSHKMFGRLVKAVVDIEQEIMVVDAELQGALGCRRLARKRVSI